MISRFVPSRGLVLWNALIFRQEAKDGRIQPEGDDTSAVDAMIDFLYTHAYNNYTVTEGEDTVINFDVKVFTTADKYLIEALQAVAADKFLTKARAHWEGSDFIEAIIELYIHGSRRGSVLHKAALSVIVEHTRDFYGERETYASFHSTLKDIPALARDVNAALAEHLMQLEQMQGFASERTG